MSTANFMLTFIFVGMVPYLASKMLGWFQFGFVAEIYMGYIIPFLLNWIILIISDLIYFQQNCDKKQKPELMGYAMTDLAD